MEKSINQISAPLPHVETPGWQSASLRLEESVKAPLERWIYQVDNEWESVWWCYFSTFKESVFHAKTSMSLSAWWCICLVYFIKLFVEIKMSFDQELKQSEFTVGISLHIHLWYMWGFELPGTPKCPISHRALASWGFLGLTCWQTQSLSHFLDSKCGKCCYEDDFEILLWINKNIIGSLIAIGWEIGYFRLLLLLCLFWHWVCHLVSGPHRAWMLRVRKEWMKD